MHLSKDWRRWATCTNIPPEETCFVGLGNDTWSPEKAVTMDRWHSLAQKTWVTKHQLPPTEGSDVRAHLPRVRPITVLCSTGDYFILRGQIVLQNYVLHHWPQNLFLRYRATALSSSHVHDANEKENYQLWHTVQCQSCRSGIAYALELAFSL